MHPILLSPQYRRHNRGWVVAVRDRWKGATYGWSNPTFVDTDVALATARGTTRRKLQRRCHPHGFIQLDRRRLD